mgnify:CR=1 FL=1
MTSTIPDLAPILARVEHIVYEQECRAAGGDPIDRTGTYASMTGDELDAALNTEHRAACALIDDERAGASDLEDAHAYLHAAIETYADAIAREHEVQAPKESALAACDVARASAYIRSVIAYPRALAALDALDALETVATEYAHGAEAHMGKLGRVIDAAHHIGARVLPSGGAEPERTAVLVYLNAYIALRASARPDSSALARVAEALDGARARLLARYVESIDAAAALGAEVQRMGREAV